MRARAMRVVLRFREWRRRRSHVTINRDQILPGWLGLSDLVLDVVVWLLLVVPPSALLGFLAWRWVG